MCEVEINSKLYKFELVGGNSGVFSLSDELLDTEERAEERALSEFLKNGHSVNSVSFSTYRTDFNMNDTISLMGMPYLVKDIATDIDAVKIVTTITCTRYD